MASQSLVCSEYDLCQTNLNALSGAWFVADGTGTICHATPSARRWLNGRLPPAERDQLLAFIEHITGDQDNYGLLPLSHATWQGITSPALWCDHARLVHLRPVETQERVGEVHARIIARFSEALRGPVTKLGLAADLLVRGRPDRRKRYGDILSQETGRLARLTENLTLLSQVMIPSPLPYHPISLGQLAQAIRDSFRSQADQECLFDQDTGALSTRMVRASPQLIGRAVLNLAAFGSNGDKATVQLEADDWWIKIVVHSPDLAGEELPDLFEPFVEGRIDLELVAARAIISHHKGHITVKSDDESGGVFTLWLPAHTEGR